MSKDYYKSERKKVGGKKGQYQYALYHIKDGTKIRVHVPHGKFGNGYGTRDQVRKEKYHLQSWLGTQDQ